MVELNKLKLFARSIALYTFVETCSYVDLKYTWYVESTYR